MVKFAEVFEPYAEVHSSRIEPLPNQISAVYENNGVTNYVADGFNLAEKLSGDKRTSVVFAMTILQRRLAPSPMAIF